MIALAGRGKTSPITVLQSFPDPRPTTNPYIVQLLDRLNAENDIRVQTFSWRRALLGRWDVFHVHWPEILVSGNGSAKAAVRQLLFVMLMLRIRLTRGVVVRTVHNLELPTGLTRGQRILLQMLERLTVHRIVLNRTTRLPLGQRSTTVPHGDYRAWFERFDRPSTIAGRIAYFGLIRRYKNVESLAAAFSRLPGEYSLVIAGRPSSTDLREAITRELSGDPRAATNFEFLSDEALARVASEAQVVVLPYRHMHNSGGVLAALSLDRPVVVPANEANDDLAAEVGEMWVIRYDSELSADLLEHAVKSAATIPAGTRPDLTRRSWDLAGPLHVKAYREAVSARSRLHPLRYSR